MRASERGVLIASGGRLLEGDLAVPRGAVGIVVLSPGSGTDRHSGWTRHLARALNAGGLATLRMDLLTVEEEMSERWSLNARENIEHIALRLDAARSWIRREVETQGMELAFLGASTGASAALLVAERNPGNIAAVVCQSGRVDLVADVLPRVFSPTLLLVGEHDEPTVELNRKAYASLGAERKGLHVVGGASHRFEELGAVDEVARLAVNWFKEGVRSALNQRTPLWPDEPGVQA
jgi:dienelactone hydrolase